MASKDEIKTAILKSAGNPTSGVIADLADTLARAVWELDNKASDKEVRVVDTKETR